MGDGRARERGVSQRRQRDEGDAIGEASGNRGLPRQRDDEAGLAHAAGTNQGQQPHVVLAQQPQDCLHVPFAANQRRQRDR